MAGPKTAAPDAQAETPQKSPHQAMVQAAQTKTDDVPEATVSSALAWFMEDEEFVHQGTKQLNVGTEDQPRWIEWTYRSLTGAEIDGVNRASTPARGARRQGAERNIDEVQRRIVALATVDPDLDAIADSKGVQRSVGDPLWHRMQILDWRFRNKSGLITQLSGEIMALSGYDEDDIRGVPRDEPGVAAGNG